ncbi:hypothetical protein Glove_40g173 [Diversispora epigaea]|uniref:Uncharacterized protein n=1 Tax=Diversispora epigaea TaxID=1348612 RepID=A0A397JQF0_9GLOM|nr:hypothetical protein Glove_40g173 [Diversispora epigaea]
MSYELSYNTRDKPFSIHFSSQERSSKIENNNKNNSNGNDAESDDLVQTNSTNSRISMNLSIKSFENDYQARKKLVESADEVYELLSHEVSHYKNYMLNVPRFNDGCWKDKMIKFEKKESDPLSFKSSFQLLEKENEENLVGRI